MINTSLKKLKLHVQLYEEVVDWRLLIKFEYKFMSYASKVQQSNVMMKEFINDRKGNKISININFP